jgi:hypothetical protein
LCCNGCFVKFAVKVDVEESIVNGPLDYNCDKLNLTSLFALFVFLICSLKNQCFKANGSFTIDSSRPDWKKKHPVLSLWYPLITLFQPIYYPKYYYRWKKNWIMMITMFLKITKNYITHIKSLDIKLDCAKWKNLT